MVKSVDYGFTTLSQEFNWINVVLKYFGVVIEVLNVFFLLEGLDLSFFTRYDNLITTDSVNYES